MTPQQPTPQSRRGRITLAAVAGLVSGVARAVADRLLDHVIAG
jgi:hypothetical protein